MNFVGRSLVRLGNALYPMFVSLAIGGCSADAPAIEDTGLDAAIAPDVAEPDASGGPSAGALDPTFGVGGVLPLDVGNGYASALAVHGDKLLVCATIQNGPQTVARVVQFDAEGVRDTSFGTEGQITFASLVNSMSCRDVAISGEHIAVLYKYANDPTSRLMFRDQQGAPVSQGEPWSVKQASKVTPLSDGAVLVGSRGTWSASMTDLLKATDAQAQAIAPSAELDGSLVRGWVDADATAVGVGVFGTEVPAWEVVTGTFQDVALHKLGLTARAMAGSAAADMLEDAVRLPDGSVFAIGSVESEKQVMTARFVRAASPQVFVEHHAIGASASGRAVTLDGSDRPIVVGHGEAAGARRFAWQRYLPTSAKLDGAYGTDGVITAVPPSGHGELVDVVRLGGKIYALGHYDVETAEPKIALLRIVE